MSFAQNKTNNYFILEHFHFECAKGWILLRIVEGYEDYKDRNLNALDPSALKVY